MLNFVGQFLGEGFAPAGRLIRDYAAKLFFLVIPELLTNFVSRACYRPPWVPFELLLTGIFVLYL